MNELLSAYKRDLALKGYSECTCRHYFTNAKQFLMHYNLPIEQIGTEKILCLTSVERILRKAGLIGHLKRPIYPQ